MKAKESATSVTVCNGCCCGRTEKGHSEIPLDNLKDSWRKFNLEDKIKLRISDCLGPCSMHNVTLLKTSKGQTWLGSIKRNITVHLSNGHVTSKNKRKKLPFLKYC